MLAADELRQAVDRVEAAASHFITGDSAPYKAGWSYADDVTIFGGWGGYEKGWEQVDPRLDWAAGCFRGGYLTYEPLAVGMSGDLAYAVGIERGEAHVAGSEDISSMTLRVTHIFRREEGIWKLIHRHADHIIEKIAARAILQET